MPGGNDWGKRRGKKPYFFIVDRETRRVANIRMVPTTLDAAQAGQEEK
jgi:hypothetical protein